MESLLLFFYTFTLIALSEIGDKTQIVAGTSSLTHSKLIIFCSTVTALIVVAGLTIFFAGLIPEKIIPILSRIGGIAFIAYGWYLFFSNESDTAGSKETNQTRIAWRIFLSHFCIVVTAELGDKSQYTTLAIAFEKQDQLYTVFAAVVTGFIVSTALTTWIVTKIPEHYSDRIKKIGAVLMCVFGVYMIVN